MLDEAAILACAAYVDLNPIRAALAETIETSPYTSAQQRAFELQRHTISLPAPDSGTAHAQHAAQCSPLRAIAQSLRPVCLSEDGSRPHPPVLVGHAVRSGDPCTDPRDVARRLLLADPDGEFEVLFRFYGPLPSLFDKTWVLPDIEPVKQ